MIGSSHAAELEVVGEVAALLRSASFGREGGLWAKGGPAALPAADQLSKRYEYTKLGRLLGIATTRFLALGPDALYYFDDPNSLNPLGYCPLPNTYLQWLELSDGRFMLVVSNGSEATQFYFSSAAFWSEQRTALARSAVLLNFREDFEVLEELGEGSFARVHRVRERRTGEEFAAKMVGKASASAACIAMLAEERRILCSFPESNYIYQFREFHETNEEYVLLVEYLPGVDLMSFLRMQLDLSLADRKFLLTNILMGLRECHEGSIIHRDLKPQNIIVDVHTCQSKIIDFGLSLAVEERGTQAGRTKCGTVGYMAPEVFLKSYGEKCDVFSFGIIAHLVLLGANPLKGKNYEETALRNQAGKVPLNEAEIVENYGENCLTFLRRCLAPAEERYSAEEALMSAFLRESSGKSSVTTDDDPHMRASFD